MVVTPKFIYHITSRDNLESICKYELKSHSSAHSDHKVHDISDPAVNSRRSRRRDPVYKKPLHSYVPLYFRANNPMMYTRRNLQPELVVLRFSLKKVIRTEGVLFTDGNAAALKTRFYAYSSMDHMRKVLDWDLLYGDWDYWKDENGEQNNEGIRRRCAEVLVPGRIPSNQIHSVVVQSDLVETIANIQLEGNNGPNVICRPKWFSV